MKLENGELRLSATDLSKHLACRHATALDVRAERGEIKRIVRKDPSLDVLIERGFRHEAAYLDYLRAKGRKVVNGGDGTLDAMHSGADVIAQATLLNGRWRG